MKLDITSDEVLVEETVLRPIGHQYSDAPLPGGIVSKMEEHGSGATNVDRS